MVERKIHNVDNLRIQAKISNVEICEDRLISLQGRLEELFQGIDNLNKLITSDDEPATKFVRS